MAELLCALLPSLEMVRLVSSGTEATMSAIRLARGFTGRDLLIKFEGCYHGHSDSLLVKAGSGAADLRQSESSGGVPADLVKHTLVLDYNDPGGLEAAFTEHGSRIAGVIVEAVAGNMNLIAPRPAFLQTMRDLCTRHGAVLIFDEVMTGFRVGPQGAQGLYGITPGPDHARQGDRRRHAGRCVSAAGARSCRSIAPLGPVYQAGTLSGNPVAVAAGLATLKMLQVDGFHAALRQRTRDLTAGLAAAASRHGVPFSAQSIGGMFGVYFRSACPQGYAEVMESDQEAFRRFFHAMLAAGHYFAPSAFEAGFVSAAHSEADIAATVAAADAVFSAWR
jgi:glutamate-1-semialdehyde 2,1-aminomutase